MRFRNTNAVEHDEDEARLWEAYHREPHSPRTRDRLVEALLPLVHKVLRRMLVRVPANITAEDLFQVGAMALCRTIEKYDPTRAIPFRGFAYPRIRGAMLDYLRAEDRVPRSCRDRLAEVEKAIQEFTHQRGIAPSEDELANALAVSRRDLDRLLDRARPWLSLDEILDKDPSRGFAADRTIVDDTVAAPDEEAEKRDRFQSVRRALLRLDAREQKILYFYYYEDLTLAEIAAVYELTEARISQIHALAVTKLRALLADNETHAVR